jgi:hypothetical protein
MSHHPPDPQPIEAEFEPAGPSPTPADTPRLRRSPPSLSRLASLRELMLASALAAICGALLGGAAAIVYTGAGPAPETPAIEARMERQARDLAAARRDVADLRTDIDAMTSAAIDDAGASEAALLERALARIDQLETALTDSENRRSTDMADMRAQLDRLRADFDASVATAALAQSPGSASSVGVLASAAPLTASKTAEEALARLYQAANTGAPFRDQLTGVLRLAPGDPDAGALERIAEEGAPSTDALVLEFAQATAALERSELARMDEGWNWLRMAMPGTPPAYHPDATTWTYEQTRIERARKALKRGALEAALSELGALGPRSSMALSGWVRRAGDRAETDLRLAALNQRFARAARDADS